MGNGVITRPPSKVGGSGVGDRAYHTFLNFRLVFFSKKRTHSSALPLDSFHPRTLTPTMGAFGAPLLEPACPPPLRVPGGSLLPFPLPLIAPLPLPPARSRSAAGPLGALLMLTGRPGPDPRLPPRPPRPPLPPRAPAGASMSRSPSRSIRTLPPPDRLVIPPLLTREERVADIAIWFVEIARGCVCVWLCCGLLRYSV